jgi:macrodomain Ter protein organizer (MatP/YcbG family)
MKEHTENVDIELSTEVFMTLAKQAHERDITLNEHINEILKKTIKDSEYQFENGTKPQFLTEDPP